MGMILQSIFKTILKYFGEPELRTKILPKRTQHPTSMQHEYKKIIKPKNKMNQNNRPRCRMILASC